jgi:hypothetical protein
MAGLRRAKLSKLDRRVTELGDTTFKKSNNLSEELFYSREIAFSAKALDFFILVA